MKKSGSLSERELERYNRQIRIDDFGEEGQRKLKSASVFVAGVGGLGSLATLYLTGAGIGSLEIVDDDEVELSNLNRQVLYREKDVGRDKADVAEEKLSYYNSDIKVEGYKREINKNSAHELLEGCDLVIDCMDNYPARYALNKACVEKNIPLFHAAVEGMNGQATTIIPGKTPCLKCIVPKSPPSKTCPVLGATPGLLATIQVHEVIKYLLDIGNLLTGELLIVESGSEFNKIEINKNPECGVCGNK